MQCNSMSFGRVGVFFRDVDELQRLLALVAAAQDAGLDGDDIGLELMQAVVAGRVLEESAASPTAAQTGLGTSGGHAEATDVRGCSIGAQS